MSSSQAKIVKWSFPAFALIIGLLWYKRRRVDRVDPGGITKAQCASKPTCTNTTSLKTQSSSYDSGIEESFGSNGSPHLVEDVNCSPRKMSESRDIPCRKASVPISVQSSAVSGKEKGWYEQSEKSPNTMEIQLGSNPAISNFEAVARSRSSTSLENIDKVNGKVMKIFENVTEEEEQKMVCDVKPLKANDKTAENVETPEDSDSTQDGQQVDNSPEDTTKTQTQVVSERDSANHSPLSGVLEGSVTDEARSEGSTDSGKGGSIKGTAKDTVIPTIYEFSIPQHIVGRLIGSRGSFLQQIRTKADVSIHLKRHPAKRSLQICAIEGSTEGINIALDIIRQKFPEKRYPEVTLEQINISKVSQEFSWPSGVMQLSLVEGVNNDVVVCHIIKPNRLFVQLPTHPTFPYLRVLDGNMTQLYNTTEAPAVPDELTAGMIVVAKWYNTWRRACIEQPDPQGERHLVRFIDHGGYWFFSSAEMRKVRSDYVTLPFQAIEIFLANIQPKGGEWNQEALDVVRHMCSGIVGQAQIEGYINTNTYVNLYLNIHKHGVISLADELVARGYAEAVPLESIIPEEGISFA